MQKYLILLFVIFLISQDLFSQELIYRQKYALPEGEDKLKITENYLIREIYAYDTYGHNSVILNFEYFQGKVASNDYDTIFPYFMKLNLLDNEIEWRQIIRGEYQLAQRFIYPTENDFTILCKSCRAVSEIMEWFTDCYPTIFKINKNGEIFSHKFDSNVVKTEMYDSPFFLINDKIHFTHTEYAPINYIIDTSTFQVLYEDTFFDENEKLLRGLRTEIPLSDSTSLMSLFGGFDFANYGLFIFNSNAKTLDSLEIKSEYFSLIFDYRILNDKIFVTLDNDKNRYLYFDKELNAFTKSYEFYEGDQKLFLTDILYINDDILGFVAYNKIGNDFNNMVIFSDYEGNEIDRIEYFSTHNWRVHSTATYNSNNLYLAYQYFVDDKDEKNNKERYDLRDTFFIVKYSLEKLVSVQDNNEIHNSISIYPNPAGDFINISIDYEAGLYTREVQILDLLGLVVSKSELTDGNNRIDISDLPRGSYFIKVGDKVEKFVKM